VGNALRLLCFIGQRMGITDQNMHLTNLFSTRRPKNSGGKIVFTHPRPIADI
jgi:hypothetical protein